MSEKHRQTVFVVDDNQTMLRSVSDFLQASDIDVETYDSAQAFLGSYDTERSGCLILDIQMPEMSGLELQTSLCSKGASLPIIIVSGHTVISDVVRAMKLGPFEFIEKPYNPELLLERVRGALRLDRKRRIESEERAELKNRFDKLSEREKQILSWVVAGHHSKMIAIKTGLTISTVDNHRANIMKKLKANTSADLTRMALLIDPHLAFSAEK